MAADLGVVVGVNDTPGSTLALRWAAEEAEIRRLPLHLTHAYRWPPFADPGMHTISPPDYETRVRRHAEAVLAASRRVVRDEHPRLEVSGEVIADDPADVLVEQSANAAMVVVGSRRLGTLAGTVLGSVGLSVAARAQCPAVVLRRPATEAARDSPVVVGVDTSEMSDHALTFAFDHANRRHLLLRVVLCWIAPLDNSDQLAERIATETTSRHYTALSDAVARWSERYPDVRLDCRVRHGHPTDTLVEESLTANLLVVGARRRRPLVNTLLGSVSQGVLHHAASPVAVIHD